MIDLEPVHTMINGNLNYVEIYNRLTVDTIEEVDIDLETMDALQDALDIDTKYDHIPF
jgi:hypothetical protein